MDASPRNVGCLWRASSGGLDADPFFATGRSRHNLSPPKPFGGTSPAWLKNPIKPLAVLEFMGSSGVSSESLPFPAKVLGGK